MPPIPPAPVPRPATPPPASRHRRPRRAPRRTLAIALLAALALAPLAVVVAQRLRPPRDPMPAARLLLAAGDAAGAEEHVRRALAARPRDAVAWHLLGECLRGRGRGADAAAATRRAHTLAPDWDAPAVVLAARALATGHAGEARRLVDDALRLCGDSPALLRLRARMSARGEGFASAAADLEAAARRAGGRARDLLDAARLRRTAAFVDGITNGTSDGTSDGSSNGAVADLLAAALRRAEQEGDPAVIAAVHLAQGQVGPTDDAAPLDESALRRVLALDRAGHRADALALAARLRADVDPARLSHAAASLAPQDGVRIAALLASPPDADDAHVAEREAAVQLVAARSSAARGRNELAVAHLRELALRRPHDPDVAFALGMRLGAAGRADVALRIAERLPGGAVGDDGRRLLGWYRVGAGEPRRAAAFLLPDTATRDDSGRRVAAALAAARERGADAVAEDALTAQERHPDDALPRLLLALVAGHRGNAEAACVHLAAALARDPSLAIAANDLAWWLATRGDAAGRAAPLAAWARHLAPDDAHVRNTDSEVRRRLGRASTNLERTPR